MPVALKIKDSGLRLRVERDLREEFVAACRAEDRTAAQVLRECMRQFVDRARAGQRELFAEKGREPLSDPRNKLPRAHAKQRRDRGSRSER
jgi:hypothetical protein